MVRSNWETSTGEVRVLMDAQTAHELVKLLARVKAREIRELDALERAVAHTLLHPDTREGTHNG